MRELLVSGFGEKQRIKEPSVLVISKPERRYCLSSRNQQITGSDLASWLVHSHF
jgi:hypothetical protein